MGEAKRRAQARKQLLALIEQADLSRISSALRRLASAASANFGSDCYIHSAIAQELLCRLGIEAILVAGYAAFRVGDGDPDVIVHAPLPGMPHQPGGAAYHAWLEVEDFILDFTTYQLRDKAAQLDALDGGTTTVIWCPDYLFAPKVSISTFQNVKMLHAGLYHYERVPDLEALFIRSAPALDIDDIERAWLLYQNQELQVFGPNSIPPE